MEKSGEHKYILNMQKETKSANQLYKESGSQKPFKEWIEEQKENGVFIPNPKLQERVEGQIQETLSTAKSYNGQVVLGVVLVGVALAAYLTLRKKK